MRWKSRFAAVSVLMVCASASAAALTYRYNDLGAGNAALGVATGINEAGAVVGYGYTGDGRSFATLWSGGTYVNLDPGSADSAAFGINDAGQIVGYVGARGAVWNGGLPSYLPTLGGPFSTARAINSAGVVAGDSYINGSDSHAALWVGTVPTDLGALSVANSFAFGLNDAGQAVGRSGTSSHATLWNGTSAVNLGTLGGLGSFARSINNLGQVVGNSDTGNGSVHATMWSGASVIDLSPLDGLGESAAWDINDASVVVGARASAGGHGAYHATVWNGIVAEDLNDLLETPIPGSGWVLTDARGINNNGWIVGMASNEALGMQHAFLLIPVSEPATYLLVLIALGFSAARVRRSVAVTCRLRRDIRPRCDPRSCA